MHEWLEHCQCAQCGSALLEPYEEDLEGGLTVEADDKFRYACIACNNLDHIEPILIEAMHQELNDYNPFDGEEASVEECYQCGRETFIVSDGRCLWCDHELDYPVCRFCEERLRQDDQSNGGLCGYHSYQYEKVMRED